MLAWKKVRGRQLTDAAGPSVVSPASFQPIAYRKAIRAIGYEQSGFHWKTAIDVAAWPVG